MKCGIISSKDLADCKCWSPRRFLDSCDECDQSSKCELPEAFHGQAKLLSKKIAKTNERLESLQNQRSELRDKLKKLPPPVWRKTDNLEN